MLDGVLGRLDGSVFRRARIGAAPDGATGRWMYATITAASDSDPRAIYSEWQAELAQGATAERLAVTPDITDAIAGSTYDLRLPGGDVVSDFGGGTGAIAAWQAFACSESREAIASSIVPVLKSNDLTLTRLRVFHPLDEAVEVIAQAPSARALSKDEAGAAALLPQIFGTPPTFEGHYLEIDAPDGTPLLITSAAFRIGASHFFSAPGVHADVGVGHAGPPPGTSAGPRASE